MPSTNQITKVKLGDIIYEIRDKLAVSFQPQTLTDAQKEQARQNIGAQEAPATAGTNGQALVLDDNGNPVWGDVTVGNATATTAGIAKLYEDVDNLNTDGAPSQKAVNEAIQANKFGAVVNEDQEMAEFIQGVGTQVAGPDVYGAVKMYDTVDGNSEDGTVTQKAVNEAITQSKTTFTVADGELVVA